MKVKNSVIRNTAIGIFLFIFMFAKAFSIGPAGPVNLQAKIDENGKQKSVVLTWDFQSDDKPDYFFIYKSDKLSYDKDDFKLLGKLKFKEGDYKYEASNLKGEEYSFFVTAAYKDTKEYNESEPSNIVDVNLNSGGNGDFYIKLNPKPVLNAEAGEEFEYKIEAKTNAPDDCPVIFELIDGPSGLSLDNESGKISWTPEAAGSFKVSIKAYLDCQNEISAETELKIIVKDGHNEKLYVKIVSKPDDEIDLGQEFTYVLKSETNAPDSCTVKYKIIGDIPDGMELVESSSSTITTETTTSMTWTPGQEGSYHVAVQAYLDCNEEISYTQKFTIKVEDDDDDNGTGNQKKYYLKIVSKPYQFGDAGEEWKYQIEVKSNAPSDCKVLYKLSDDAPEGMELVVNSSTFSDSEATSMTWTPEEPGIYQFWLYASLDCNEKVTDKQRIVINVKKKTADDTCATLSGTVSDEEGNPIPSGSIMAWRVDDKSDNSEYKQVYKHEFLDGAFSFNVSEGTYVVKAAAYKYKDEWYENTMGIDHATRIDMECSNEYSVTFTLESNGDIAGDEESATFTGNVTAAEGNTPVMAIVEFIPYKWITGTDDIKPKISKYSAKTDSTGQYIIIADAGEKYIAMAIPESGSGYMNQYFENQSDPYQATIIDPESSTFQTIDFGLVKSEEFTNGFGGLVQNNDANPLKSKLIAYLAEPLDTSISKFAYAQITESDDDGKFEFKNLLPGKYIVLSIPFEKVYVPGYYKEDEYVVHKWQKSTLLEIADTYYEEEITVKHKVCTGLKGIANMKGYIHRHRKGSVKFDSEKPQESDAISGAIIYAYNSQNEVVNYCLSDNSGSYIIDELTGGAYTLLGDKAGMIPVESNVDIAYQDNLSIEVNFELGEIVTEVKDNPLSAIPTNIRLYPVPAKDIINISFDSAKPIGNLAIFDLKGTRLYSESPNAELQYYSIDISNLSPGQYILRISSNQAITDIGFKVIK